MSRFLPSSCSSTISVIPCIGNPVAFRTGELYFLMSNELGHNLIMTLSRHLQNVMTYTFVIRMEAIVHLTGLFRIIQNI
jgi:hypothetical protein